MCLLAVLCAPCNTVPVLTAIVLCIVCVGVLSIYPLTQLEPSPCSPLALTRPRPCCCKDLAYPVIAHVRNRTKHTRAQPPRSHNTHGTCAVVFGGASLLVGSWGANTNVTILGNEFHDNVADGSGTSQSTSLVSAPFGFYHTIN